MSGREYLARLSRNWSRIPLFFDAQETATVEVVLPGNIVLITDFDVVSAAIIGVEVTTRRTAIEVSGHDYVFGQDDFCAQCHDRIDALLVGVLDPILEQVIDGGRAVALFHHLHLRVERAVDLEHLRLGAEREPFRTQLDLFSGEHVAVRVAVASAGDQILKVNGLVSHRRGIRLV